MSRRRDTYRQLATRQQSHHVLLRRRLRLQLLHVLAVLLALLRVKGGERDHILRHQLLAVVRPLVDEGLEVLRLQLAVAHGVQVDLLRVVAVGDDEDLRHRTLATVPCCTAHRPPRSPDCTPSPRPLCGSGTRASGCQPSPATT